MQIIFTLYVTKRYFFENGGSFTLSKTFPCISIVKKSTRVTILIVPFLLTETKLLSKLHVFFVFQQMCNDVINTNVWLKQLQLFQIEEKYRTRIHVLDVLALNFLQ